MKEVKDKIVLITGAGSPTGIGRGLALRFAAAGSILVLWDVNEETLIDAANKVTEIYKKNFPQSTKQAVYYYTVDLCDRKAIYKVADRVKNDAGKVDILVNNAGLVSAKPFLQISDEDAERVMDVNINAHFWTVKAFLPAMIQENSGHIITIASAAGLFGVNALADYCASKFAAVGFAESIRLEMRRERKTGVHTTVVCPYYINTGMFAGVKTRYPWILPILEPDYVVDKIFNAVLNNYEFLALPNIINLLVTVKSILPNWLTDYLAGLLGISSGLDDFKGRTAANYKLKKEQ